MNGASASIFLILILSIASSTYGEIEQANPTRFALLIEKENTILVDVRTPAEAKAARIKDSQLIDYYGASFEQKIQELPKDKVILLYCRSGNRSGKTAMFLEKQGFEQLVNLSGGINAWKQADLPVEEM